MKRVKPNHPLARPPRNKRPHTRPYLQTFRTELRQNLTPAEARLWQVLQRSQIDRRKFRRQHSTGDYILDFYCPSERLAVELDGQVHVGDYAELLDQEREVFMRSYGIKVIRFENHLVFDQMEYVVARIRAWFGWWREET